MYDIHSSVRFLQDFFTDVPKKRIIDKILDKQHLQHLNNYFKLHFCLSVFLYVGVSVHHTLLFHLVDSPETISI